MLAAALSGAACGTAGVAGTAASGGTWPNAPAGWTVVTDYDTHALNGGGWSSAYTSDSTSGQLSVINDPTGPLNTTAWQFYFQRGNASLCGTSPGTEYYNLPSPTKQLYVGFWIKFTNPFSFPQDPEVHVQVNFTAAGNGSGIVWDMTQSGDVYWVNEFAGNGGNSNIYASRSPSWSLGGWHQVEMLFDYAGTAKAWVDGALTVNASGVAYPPDAGFNMVEVSPTWGGCTPPLAPATDGWIWYNHVHVRTP